MRTKRFLSLKAVLAGLGAIALAIPAGIAAQELGMLDNLTPGMWEVRERDSGKVHRVCVRNGRELIQLRHKSSKCDRLVVQDEAGRVTVEYTCRGNGYGRTTIRRETASLAQIQTQGFENGLPFDFRAEARRVGGC